MKKEKYLFLALWLSLILFFLLCGYSLITCFVYGFTGDEGDYHILEIAYLFIHLVIIAIVFYLAFKAYKTQSSIMKLMMVDEYGQKNRKGIIISGILAGLFFTVAIYSTLHLFGLPMPPLNYLPVAFSHDFMNAGYTFGAIALAFFLFPYLYQNEEPIKAE